MKKEKTICLSDWLTNEKFKFASKLTEDKDRVFHSHSFYEFFYVTSGRIAYRFNDQEIITLQAGDFCFMNIGDSHIFLREEGDECVHRDIVIRPDLFKELCDCVSPTMFAWMTSDHAPLMTNLTTNRVKEFETKCDRINQLMTSSPDDAISAIRLFVFELIGSFFLQNNPNLQMTGPIWFSDLMERFSDIDNLKGGLPEITKPFFYTYEHICRVFKEKTGMTMTEYLNQRRVFEAANMLIYTNKSVSEIYNSLGISSASYFNKVFKAQYHVSPYRFRKQGGMASRK